MNPTMKAWLLGALNAAVSGITSGSIGIGVGIGWRKSLIIAGGAAFVSFSKWFAQNPIPTGPKPE